LPPTDLPPTGQAEIPRDAGPDGPVSLRGERTRQAILDSAHNLFVTQGFHATSMRQIAQAAGIALGGIYNHFSGKEEIFDHVLLDKHPYRQILQVLETAPGNDPESFVRSAARAALEIIGERPDFMKLVFIELSEFQGKHAPHLFREIYPHFERYFRRFSAPGGRLRPGLPTQAVIFSFLGTLFSYYLTWSVSGSPGALSLDDDPIRHNIEILLHGILSGEQP
jgi:AcrR family transcriptional regulator